MMNNVGLSTHKRPRSVEPVTALHLLQQQQQQNRLAPVAILQNWAWKLPPGTLTELAGPAGAGKTQLALTLCVDTVLLNQKAVYIFLGGSNVVTRASQRLETMFQTRSTINNNNNNNNNIPHDTTMTTVTVTSDQVHEWLSSIFLHWIRNTEDLKDLLETSLPALLEKHPTINLVVLDGIANLFRVPEEGEDNGISNNENVSPSNPVPAQQQPQQQFWHIRATTFFQLSTRCKFLADQYQLAFLILNQATTRWKSMADKTATATTTLQESTSSTSRLEPALGLSWSQCVNATMFVERSPVNAMYQPQQNAAPNNNTPLPTPVSKRHVRCIKAPWIASNATIDFYIDNRGTVRIIPQT